MEDLDAWIQTCLRSPSLDDAEVESLERNLVLEPDDVRGRTQLLVHYWRLQVALADGNVAEAKARLRDATIHPGRLRHKPDARLAKELILRGEDAAAIEYLDATRRLGWSVAELSAWFAQKQGVTLRVVR